MLVKRVVVEMIEGVDAAEIGLSPGRQRPGSFYINPASSPTVKQAHHSPIIKTSSPGYIVRWKT